MDNNNLTPQGPTVPPAPANIPPVAPQPQQMMQPDKNSDGSGKLIIWFVLGLILVALIVGGTYLYLSRQAAVVPQTDISQVSQQPTPKPQENLEDEIENVNVDDTQINGEFSSIDKDLQQL